MDGEPVFDAEGLVLAPGFIDTHSHHDGGLLDELPALAVVSQGITTIVAGQDSGSPFPLADFFACLDASPAAVNVASYAGLGTLHREVMGDDFRRGATMAELQSMRELLEAELASGALDLSTGLEYDRGSTPARTRSSRSQRLRRTPEAGTSRTCGAKNGPFTRPSRRRSRSRNHRRCLPLRVMAVRP